MLQINSNWDPIEKEIDRLERMPDGKTRQALKATINTGFALTQAAVHVETGALKASGRVSDSYDRFDREWTGEIQYGDDSGPVDYAIYEKRRGVHWVGPSAAKGDHDFFTPLKALHELFVTAILMGMK